jgi:hypothetical protein
MDLCLYDISEWELPQDFLNVGHQVVNYTIYMLSFVMIVGLSGLEAEDSLRAEFWS